MKLYVASSWRNVAQPAVVARLQAEGFAVYDFRHPNPDNDGFSWGDVTAGWQGWTPAQFRDGLKHPIAVAGFSNDFDAMQDADACLLLLPCGRSAHLEAGYFVGASKPLVILLAEDGETIPELMYKMADDLCLTLDEAVECLNHHANRLAANYSDELAACLEEEEGV